MADDLSARELGCYGNLEHATPNLDALARDGVKVETCWATPICSPTRAEVLTGRYGCHTGWYHNAMKPAEGEPGYNLAHSNRLFSQLLKQAGYATAICGKWQLPGTPAEHDFDEFCLWERYSGLQWAGRDRDQWHQRGPHRPLLASGDRREWHAGADHRRRLRTGHLHRIPARLCAPPSGASPSWFSIRWCCRIPPGTSRARRRPTSMSPRPTGWSACRVRGGQGRSSRTWSTSTRWSAGSSAAWSSWTCATRPSCCSRATTAAQATARTTPCASAGRGCR